MRFQRGSSGLTALFSLFAVLSVTAVEDATIEKKGEWPADDKKISLDIDHVGQEEAIKRLAEEAGWSVIVKGMGDEKTSLHVKDQSAEKVLGVLLAEGNWIAQRDGTLISISRNPNPKAESVAVPVTPGTPVVAPVVTVPAIPPPNVVPVPPLPPLPPLTPPAIAKPEVKVQLSLNSDDAEDSRKGTGKDREVVGQSLEIGKDEVVRNVQLVGGSLVIKGTVTGDVNVVGGKVELESGSRVMGDVEVMGGSVEVKNGARIDGDTEIVGGHLDRQEGAIVHGNVSTRIEGEDEHDGNSVGMGARMVREIGECTTAGAFMFALGAVLIALFTKRSESIKVEFAARPMRMFALGIAGFFGGLLVLAAMCVTLIGIPFAAIGLLLGIFATFAAMTSVLEVIGRALIGHKTKNEYAHLALGCTLFAVVMMIPGVDDIAKLVLMFVSIGSLVATRAAGLIPPRKNGQTMSDAHPYRSAEAV